MTEPYHADNLVTLHHGDCLDHLRSMPDNSVDAIVTDPPYGLSNTTPDKVADTIVRWASGDREHVPEGCGFMGRPWDAFVPPPAVWDECLRVLKPGGHMAVFAGSRTQDLMGMSIRLAGFELRDSLAWIYGSGMPKSHNVSKAMDRAAGELAPESTGFTVAGYSHNPDKLQHTAPSRGYTPPKPVTDDAKRWAGWGTALKPAQEPIILARKPLDGTVAANVLAHGVGGLNIDACRVETSDSLYRESSIAKVVGASEIHEGWDRPYRYSQELVDKANEETRIKSEKADRLGRFPANVLLDEHAATEMDRQSGVSVSAPRTPSGTAGSGSATGFSRGSETSAHSDSGGASRFFPVFKYQAKAPKKERPVIERPPMLQLRDDLTPEQVDHVRARLQEVGIEIE